MVEGRTVQSIVARQRWDMDALYNPDGGPNKIYTRMAALVEVSLRLCKHGVADQFRIRFFMSLLSLHNTITSPPFCQKTFNK